MGHAITDDVNMRLQPGAQKLSVFLTDQNSIAPLTGSAFVSDSTALILSKSYSLGVGSIRILFQVRGVTT
jgi:hypothetical protein